MYNKQKLTKDVTAMIWVVAIMIVGLVLISKI